MFKPILVLIFLFSTALSTFRSMSKKSIDFGDNVCYYKETDDQNDYFYYVKPCTDGKYCTPMESSHFNLHTCEPYIPLLTTINGNCQTDFECGGYSLECTGGSEKHCTVKSSSTFSIQDPASRKTKYFCHSDKLPYSTPSSPSFNCGTLPTGIQKSEYENKYLFTNSYINYYMAPALYKVPGKINFKTKQDNQDYLIDSIDTAYIGSLPVETFVEDPMACESGFALSFYGNGKLEEPTETNPTSHNLYYYCVNVKEVDSVNGFIKYTLKDDVEKIYNCNKGSSISCSATLMTELEMFKNYKEKLDSIRSECETSNYDEPFTCGNNELRKWWYFYNYPGEYILYKDEKEIIDFLVQKAYPGYTPENSNRFLNLKYFFYLLLLIAL